MDVGILLLRVLTGLTVSAHGAQKLFGIFGGHGIKGTAQFLESLGFRRGSFFAYLLGIGEFAGGALLAMGLFTPVAAMTIIAIMTAAALAVHRGNGFFATEGGIELPFLVATVAAAISFTGAGFYSWDALLELPLGGTETALSAIALGVLAGVATVSLKNLPEKVPFRKTQAQN